MKLVELDGEKTRNAENVVGTEGADNVTTRVLRSAAEVEEIRDVWLELCVHPNSDIDFFLNVIGSRQEILCPHVIVLTRGGAHEAVLVGRIEDTFLEAKVGYKVLQRSPVRRLTVVHGGLLGNFGAPNAAVMMGSLMKALADREADVVWFNSVRLDAPICAAAKTACGRLFGDYFVEKRPHWKARLGGSYRDFVRNLSSNTRHNLKRYSSRLVKVFGTEIVVRCLRDRGELDQIMIDTESVASKTYHRGLGVGFIDNPETRRLTAHALKHGWYRAYILYIGGIPCAFWNGLHYRSTFFTGTTGSHPTYREHRLGTFLLTKVIEDLCQEEHLDSVDFGLGDAQYKQDFCGENWLEGSFYLFAPTSRGLMLNAIRTPIVGADRLARHLLGKAKLLDKVKRAWRQSVTNENHPTA